MPRPPTQPIAELGASAAAAIPGPDALVRPLVSWAVASISVVAVLIAVWGVSRGLVHFVRIERARLSGRVNEGEGDQLRHLLGFYTLLVLSFLVAADIVETLVRPTFEHLAVLGGVVAIRAATGITLARELRESGA